MASNFAFMTPYSQELASLGTQAEAFFVRRITTLA